MADTNLPVPTRPDFPQDPLTQFVKLIADSALPRFFEQLIDAAPERHIAWRAQQNQIFIKGIGKSECDRLTAAFNAALPSFIHVNASFKPYPSPKTARREREANRG
jgi:hypothetical protein